MNNCYLAVGTRMFYDTLRNRAVATLKKKLPTHFRIWKTPSFVPPTQSHYSCTIFAIRFLKFNCPLVWDISATSNRIILAIGWVVLVHRPDLRSYLMLRPLTSSCDSCIWKTSMASTLADKRETIAPNHAVRWFHYGKLLNYLKGK